MIPDYTPTPTPTPSAILKVEGWERSDEPYNFTFHQPNETIAEVSPIRGITLFYKKTPVGRITNEGKCEVTNPKKAGEIIEQIRGMIK